MGQDIQNLQNYYGRRQLAPQTQLPLGLQGPQFSAGQVQMPQMLSPMGQQMMANHLMQNLQNPFAIPQAQANLRYTKARTKALKQGRNRIRELVNEGYTPTDAKKIMDIFHGLKPRASAVRALEQKSLPEQLTFWQTVYNKTLDPEWGGTRPTEDMDAARDLAKQNIDRITKGMRQSTQTNGGIEADLKNARSAIQRGAPRDLVYRRLIEAYPDRAAEIRRLLGK